MAWYDAGTVNVTLNSATVTGVGTQWVAGARQGEALVGPDGRLYEVLNISSNTALTLTRPYRGPTQTAQPYALAPFQGYVKELADRAAALLTSMQTDYATVLKRADLQPAGLGPPEQGKIATTGAFGLGNQFRAWLCNASAANEIWVKLATITGQPNQRGLFILDGAGFGYGAANGATTGVGFLSATMGNASHENNLSLEYLYSTEPQQAHIKGLKTVRLSNTKFEVWVQLRTYSQLHVAYSGTFSLMEPTNGVQQAAAPDPAYHWELYMYQMWTGRTLTPANIGARMGLRSGAFADLIGDVGAGAIMQSGSNSTGHWQKFADGTMVTSQSRLIDMAGTVWTGSSPRYCQLSGAVAFPAAFLAGTAPDIIHSTSDSAVAGRSAYLAAFSRSNTAISGLFVASPSATAVAGGTIVLSFVAKGEWK